MNENHSKDDLVETQVQKTMDSLNDTVDITANPYFYSKLKANIDKLETLDSSLIHKFVFNSRIAPAIVTLLFLFNIFSFSVHFYQNKENQTESREQFIEDIANEYLDTGSSGWYEN